MKSKRSNIALSLRFAVLQRDRFSCVACGRSPAKSREVVLHVDHIRPVSKGGKNEIKNLQTLCFDCNIGKGAVYEGRWLFTVLACVVASFLLGWALASTYVILTKAG